MNANPKVAKCMLCPYVMSNNSQATGFSFEGFWDIFIQWIERQSKGPADVLTDNKIGFTYDATLSWSVPYYPPLST